LRRRKRMRAHLLGQAKNLILRCEPARPRHFGWQP
jgi:hypothetical protein